MTCAIYDGTCEIVPLDGDGECTLNVNNNHGDVPTSTTFSTPPGADCTSTLEAWAIETVLQYDVTIWGQFDPLDNEQFTALELEF